MARTPEIVDFLATQFGPYPFEAEGGVVPADNIGFALENQTRPTYDHRFWQRGADTYVVAHELAHQWYGDSVSVDTWREIWLNEGFASYAEWLWSEHLGEGTADQLFTATYNSYPADSPFWQILPGDPGAAHNFDAPVPGRGAMTLHALRKAVGDPAFFTILRNWAAQQRDGNGTTAALQALAERVSGQRLGQLFATWLHTAGRPALPPNPQAAGSAPRPFAAIHQSGAHH